LLSLCVFDTNTLRSNKKTLVTDESKERDPRHGIWLAKSMERQSNMISNDSNSKRLPESQKEIIRTNFAFGIVKNICMIEDYGSLSPSECHQKSENG
jgi:hypothetical protein